MISIVIGIGVLLILAILFVILRATSLVDVFRSAEQKRAGLSNKVNGFLFPAFFVVGLALFIWSYLVSEKDFLPTASSEHGVRTDFLFSLTMIILVIAFVATHILLFFFPYKYQFKEENKASFYPDNNKLEMLWTVIPAIVLTVLIFTGWREWSTITGEPPKDAEEIEIMGFQFAWLSRYPGQDKDLGAYNYKLINNDNQWGLDFSDKSSFDDFTPSDKVLKIPKGKAILFKIRARDVLHSVYVPHFRLKMDAVPGMPTRFWFVPTKTTAEMRKELHKPDFNYELACAEVCGQGHFAMRMIIEVVEEEEYKKWYASQASWFSKHPDYLTKVPSNLQEEAKKFIPQEAPAKVVAPATADSVVSNSSAVIEEKPAVATASLVTDATPAGSGDLKQGESLFKVNCTACHQISDQQMVGPGLKNIHKKRSDDWIVKFVKNSQALIKSGDKQAVEVFKKFNEIPMPSHDMTDDQVLSIVAYIKSESAK